MDYLVCLKSFVTSVKHNSFAGASRDLGVSPSQLTKQIHWLESHVGSALFERTTRISRLTDAGEVYYSYSLKILSDINSAQLALDSINCDPHGKIIISSPSSLSRTLLSDLYHDFLVKYPNITLRSRSGGYPPSVIDGQSDVCITPINYRNGQLIKEALFTSTKGLYASQDYVNRHGLPSSIDELAHHQCLINMQTSPDNYWNLSSENKVKVNGCYISESSDELIKLASKGMGIVFVDEILIKNEITEGDLIAIDIGIPLDDTTFYIYHRPVAKSSNIRLFCDQIRGKLLGSVAS
ncbi:LysR family transcriptional regulator [Dongshaea marina]|uniref:LysR family transcriptional regulator n=1 Tax=Dongshaea marina TaxID=2047966 RepID=UPI000D3E1F33|nr:LysR family transcriptional regulator [Dongshaea marina]